MSKSGKAHLRMSSKWSLKVKIYVVREGLVESETALQSLKTWTRGAKVKTRVLPPKRLAAASGLKVELTFARV